MSSYDFDICIIGAGPAGFAAAIRAWDFGKRVALIEKGPLGGAGVHHGALTSKTLWELSRDYQNVLRRDRGYHVDSVRLSYEQVIASVQRAIDEKVGQMTRQLNELSETTPEFPGSIQLHNGSARFLDPHTVHVEGTEAGQSRSLTAEHFVIATGSRPRTLDTIKVDGEHIITSDHVMRLRRFPKSIVILGAGVIGCEFATIFANYGRTKVYMIDRASRILPFEDDDIARICSTNFEDKGVTIHQTATLRSMEVVDDQVEYTIEHASGGIEAIRVERALISIGRIPNTDDLGLENVGVSLSERGYIQNTDGQTTAPHIYAVGDVTYDISLVNVGEIEGRHVVERIYGDSERSLSYDNLSSIIFVDPEIAAIGMNEKQAHEQRIPYRVASYGFSLVNRAIAMRSTEGFVKILVSDSHPHLLLGMRALGPHASTLIEAASLIIQLKRPASDLGELLHPHPAITEALQECVRMIRGTSIYKPHVFKSALRLSRISFEDAEGSE